MSDFLILTPVYDDWDSLGLLLPRLEAVLAREGLSAEILVVNDGSSTEPPAHVIGGGGFRAIRRVRVLDLRRNLGHQRAIAIGLCQLHSEGAGLPVVVMDADGEDDPADVVRLVRASGEEPPDHVVFASRAYRSEGLLFKMFYPLYRMLFRLFTGQSIRFGNFSVLSPEALSRVVVLSEVWNHFSAGVLRSRIPYVAVPCVRADRLAGRSHMNFVSLVTHGLSAVAVYGDVIGTRALLLTFALTVVTILSTGVALVVGLLTDAVMPGWAGYALGIAAVVLIQAGTLSLFFAFIALMGRSALGIIPIRDFQAFVGRVLIRYEEAAASGAVVAEADDGP
ncbi:MAG TPA: glycosyltransferase [Longimicrobiales bacterium]